MDSVMDGEDGYVEDASAATEQDQDISEDGYVEDASAATEEDVDISGDDEEPPGDDDPGYTYSDDDVPGEAAQDGSYEVSDM